MALCLLTYTHALVYEYGWHVKRHLSENEQKQSYLMMFLFLFLFFVDLQNPPLPFTRVVRDTSRTVGIIFIRNSNVTSQRSVYIFVHTHHTTIQWYWCIPMREINIINVIVILVHTVIYKVKIRFLVMLNETWSTVPAYEALVWRYFVFTMGDIFDDVKIRNFFYLLLLLLFGTT